MASSRRGQQRRRRALGIGVSLAAHLAVLAVLLTARQAAPPAAPPPPIEVALVGPTHEPDSGAPPAAAPTKAEAKPPPVPARPTPPRPDIKPVPATSRPEPDPVPELTDAQIANAATASVGEGEGAGEGAGAGSGGRPCDMVRRVQAALRRDPRVRAAVADAEVAGGRSGKALYIWNGEWIRSRGQEGNGLAAAREAIMWEVAFAPEACRAEPVHGLVRFSLNDRPGSGLVLGAGAWHWGDLLRPHPAG